MKFLQKDKHSANIELIERIVSVNRVSKTVKGGRNMSFSALAVVGDGRGRVGFGKGNSSEVSEAKTKASESAKKNMTKLSLRSGKTVHHDVCAKFCSSKVVIRCAPPGTGVIAGGSMRAVFECVGISDVVAKSIGNSNPYNMVAATILALRDSSPKLIAERRGISSLDVKSRTSIKNKE